MSFLKNLFNHTHTYKEDINMTNKDKALALINTFATGDTDAAKIYWLKDIFSTIWLTVQAEMLFRLCSLSHIRTGKNNCQQHSCI